MYKLTLKVDELDVESFIVPAEAEERTQALAAANNPYIIDSCFYCPSEDGGCL
jgi:hypothetical protein